MGPFEFGSLVMIECGKCKRGRSLEKDELADLETVIVCLECRNEFTILDGLVNSIISDSPFGMYEFISTRTYYGVLSSRIGECQYVNFPNPLQQVYKVLVSPNAPCIVEASQVHNNGFLLVSGCLKDSQHCIVGDEVTVSWIAYGHDADFDEPWRQLLVNARRAFVSQNYLGSILLAEIAFESFIDASLGEGYKKIGLDNDSISRFLVSMDMLPKVNPLMNNVYGLKLSNSSVWQDWEKSVLRWRNDIAHGSKVNANPDEAQLAFKTVIKAIFYFHKTVFEKCKI